MISSAVIVPEADELSPHSLPHKRRQTSSSYSDQNKRPRTENTNDKDTDGGPLAAAASSPPAKRTLIAKSRATEERKRGQRLFGALLGTLSQSSTTTAQRRRADIEKKQLGKLQLRDEEAEEAKRRRKEELDVVRQKEQMVWDRQATRLRHRNMLAEAHFLKTNAEPRVYYKPWELRPEEEVRIQKQTEDTERHIHSEATANEIRIQGAQEGAEAENGATPEASANKVDVTHAEERPLKDRATSAEPRELDPESPAPHTMINGEKECEVNQNVETKDSSTLGEGQSNRQEEKTNEDHGGEELVEGQEDDVIY